MRKRRFTRMISLAFSLASALSALGPHARAAAQPSIARASTEQQTIARAAYGEGLAAFERGEHAQALERFEAADAAVSSPNVKLMRARCLAELGRHAEAHAMYRAVTVEAEASGEPRYRPSASAAAEEALALEERMLAAGTPVTLEHTDAAPEPQPVAAPAAAIAAAPAREPAATAPAQAHDLPVLPIVLGAAGGVGLAAFAVLGSMSNAQLDELERGCPSREACAPELADAASRGRSYQTLANVSLGAGVLLVAAGTTLLVLDLSSDDVQVGLTAQGVRLQGSL
jgi:tetratricopeptide (TPR) repeat protein